MQRHNMVDCTHMHPVHPPTAVHHERTKVVIILVMPHRVQKHARRLARRRLEVARGETVVCMQPGAELALLIGQGPFLVLEERAPAEHHGHPGVAGRGVHIFEGFCGDNGGDHVGERAEDCAALFGAAGGDIRKDGARTDDALQLVLPIDRGNGMAEGGVDMAKVVKRLQEVKLSP